jgi:hypothetical protein
MKVKVGDRVVAIMNSTSKIVEVFGHGVYLGEAVPPTGDLMSMGLSSAKIMLDDTRELIWGHECVWMCEKRFESHYLKGREVVLVQREEGLMVE